jgi:hypothetical protein
VIREKLTLNVYGLNQEEVRRRVVQIAGEYLGLDQEELLKVVDIELEVTATDKQPDSFSATAYVRVKN